MHFVRVIYIHNRQHKPFKLKAKQLHSMALVHLQHMAKAFGVDQFYMARDRNGLPQEAGGLFWSLSHKNTPENDVVLAVGLSDRKNAVDIELIVPRSEELLNIFHGQEYMLVGGKNWHSFYILWTAKEAVIKLINGTLSDMKGIQCIAFNANEIWLRYSSSVYTVMIHEQLIYNQKYILATSL